MQPVLSFRPCRFKSGALLAVSLGLALSGHASIKRTVEKTFVVTPSFNLQVQTSGGDIKVVNGPGQEVRVTALQVIKADSEEKADELLKDLNLRIEQSGDTVVAIAKYEKSGGGWFWGGGTPVQVSFTVVVPSQCNVDLKTSGGNINLASIRGRADVNTSGGDIRIERVDGVIEGHTSGGNITLGEGTAQVKLRTSGGDIRVDKAGGEVELGTSGGNIDIGSGVGRVTATTSGGNIKAAIKGALTGDCNLSTSGGSVRATVDAGVAFNLEAKTSGGDVDASGLTITIEEGGLRKSRLAGKVNGGGPTLLMRSSGGDIRIRTN